MGNFSSHEQRVYVYAEISGFFIFVIYNLAAVSIYLRDDLRTQYAGLTLHKLYVPSRFVRFRKCYDTSGNIRNESALCDKAVEIRLYTIETVFNYVQGIKKNLAIITNIYSL